jgi:hypothetical protein
MWETRKSVVPLLLLGTTIFPLTAVPTTPTARYRKNVVGKLHTKFHKTFLNILYEDLLTMNVTTSAHLQCHPCNTNKQIHKQLSVFTYAERTATYFLSLRAPDTCLYCNTLAVTHTAKCSVQTCTLILLIQIPLDLVE